MTEQSDKELQEFIDHKMSIDYRDEEVQKKTIIAHDMGAEITLYDWIHRYDNLESARNSAKILDLGDLDVLWLEEYKKFIREYMTNG